MNFKTFFPLILTFLAAIFVACEMAIRLPFIEEWPYTWALYAALFAIGAIVVIICNQKRMPKHPEFPLSAVPLIFIIYSLFASAFLCLVVRASIEYRMSPSFQFGEVIGKYRSANHNYPALQIHTEKNQFLSLDIPGQEALWQSVNVGDYLAKKFGTDMMTPIAPTANHH